jgi:hypothetical protein
MAHVLRLCVVHRVSGTLSAAAVELTFSSSAPPGCEAHATVVAPVTTKHPNLNTQLFMIIAFRFVAVCKHSLHNSDGPRGRGALIAVAGIPGMATPAPTSCEEIGT